MEIVYDYSQAHRNDCPGPQARLITGADQPCTPPCRPWRKPRDHSTVAKGGTIHALPRPQLTLNLQRTRLTMLHSPLFKSDDHAIYSGSCLDVLPSIPDHSIDLLFADPPYNIGKKFGTFADVWPSDNAYAEWCFSWLSLCLAKLSSRGSLYVMTSTQAMPYLDVWLRDRINILSRLVWHYDSSGVQAKRYFGSLYEPILYGVNDLKDYVFNASDIEVEARTGAVRKLIDYRKETPTPYKTTKIPGNAWYFPRVRYRMDEYEDHPSQKPEALLERIIKASSNPGDIILDPFAGTFTTCAVAQRLGRRSIGIEMQEAYVAIGARRLGFASLDDATLAAPSKNYVRRNANGVHGGATKVDPTQLGMFHGED